MRSGHAIAQPSALGEQADEPAAERIERRVVMRLLVLQRRDDVRGPRLDLFRERAVRVVEERPVEERAVRHQSPSKTGRSFLAKAS